MLLTQLHQLNDRLSDLCQEAIAQQVANERDSRRGCRTKIRKVYRFTQEAIAQLPDSKNAPEVEFPVPESLEEIATLVKHLHQRSCQLTERVEQRDISTLVTEIAYLRAGSAAIDKAVASAHRKWIQRTGFETSPDRRAYKARWKREKNAKLREKHPCD